MLMNMIKNHFFLGKIRETGLPHAPRVSIKKKPCVDPQRPRVYIQHVPVCTGTTRTCLNTCARGAGIHGDVLNVHTGRLQRVTPHHTAHTPQHKAQHTTTQNDIPQDTTTTRPTTPHGDRERQRKKTNEDKTRQDKTK